ncbi:MAG: ATP-binding cassette domain-containing protein [Candidatus Gastranaerophilales bacterium]|nr:ATP-binding cassette domain-containing protein [Candidatus Gastranaerophilales bacterium]
MNAIEFKNVTKRFGHVVANDHISFGIEEGEIHALAGENGAGKSTLMNMLFGLLTPDEGSILVREKEMHFASPREANRNGIGMVHQHFMLIPKMPVYENVIVGVEPCRRNLINRKEAIDKVQQISDQYQLSIDCSRPVGDLTVPEQQRVEIIKILYRKANILIFDEPTAVLGPQQIDEFCEILLNLKRLGKTIIFISHKLPEVMRVADRVTVIRRGKVVGTRPIRDINTEILTHINF